MDADNAKAYILIAEVDNHLLSLCNRMFVIRDETEQKPLSNGKV